MKRFSIKFKITLFITLIMIALSVVMMAFSVNIAVRAAKNDLKETLRERVDALYADLSYTEVVPSEDPTTPNEPAKPDKRPQDEFDFRPGGNGSPGKEPTKEKAYVLTIPDDVSYASDDGVKLYINGDTSADDGKLAAGELHEGVSLPDNVEVNAIEKIGNYFLYAKFLAMPGEKGGGTWIYGTIDITLSHSIAYDTIIQALLALPFIIAVAAALGYFITKRAFNPIAKITEAAANIAGSNDLSERLNMGDGKDEISVLASTFDSMLDTIERNFEKEKQFTSDASHELRTPVAVIMAQSELAMDPNATHEDRNEAIDSINRQSKKMNKLLSELLTLARADNKCTILEKERFDLYELAEIILEEQRLYADERGISVVLKGDAGTTIEADRTQIMRVLINLVSNAIKYGNDGGFVELEIKKEENGVKCTVSDNGIGIADSDLCKIWNRFYRGDAARTYEPNGSMGLGLSMVKNIIESHGGTVFAQSVLGEGSSIGFTL